jgi:hypothetical protein
MEIRQIQRQQFLAKVFRQRSERHPKSGKAGEDRHFVLQQVRLLGRLPIQRRKLFAIQGACPQVFLHQRLRKEPAHSKFLPDIVPTFGGCLFLSFIPLVL